MKFAKRFSEFMLHVRKERCLTQMEVTKLTGISKSTYSGMESTAKQITTDNIDKFLSGMQLDMDSFVEFYKKVEL